MPYKTPSRTQIVAHRGNSGPLPENTLIAVTSAIDLGVDMVEVDVRLTKDGIPVLMHEDRVDDTTTGTGFVKDFTWEELRALDAGSWRGAEFADQSVCSLEDILDLAVERVALNLDVKVPEAAEPTAVAVMEAGASGNVVISGCNESCVRKVRDIDNGISTLLNLDDRLVGIDSADAPSAAHESVGAARELGAIAINVPHELVDAELVERAKTVDISVWAFTVDDEDRFSECIDTGVASITTNWPGRMLPILSDKNSHQRTAHP
jgi:glycerophosphoryl diester phosphodiesterase